MTDFICETEANLNKFVEESNVNGFFLQLTLFICVSQATPDMAVILLEIARIFATKVPGKIDADVLQLLWKVFSSR